MTALQQALLSAAALAAAIAGFAALSLAMDRHWGQLHGRAALLAPGTRRRLHCAGALGLLASLAACVALRGAGQGCVVWAGMLTAAAVTLVLMLSYAWRGVVRIAWAAAAVTIAALAGALAV